MITYNEKLRDPLYGFILLSKEELKIVDSMAFQRLRSIHQLALSHLVFHGAEHTRFGHSLGVLHLANRSFKHVIDNNPELFSEERAAWYLQILRLIALTHDLGHPPFSHGSEQILPNGVEHEDYTEKIIKQTSISDYIFSIGESFIKKFGADYNITPQLICDVYQGRVVDQNFIFLRKFMDSELDCDKMDYLLRDSYYCGVNYGRYDLERIINSLTVYKDDSQTMLAIKKGGINAVEGFILARYFMFIQVYFHRTRRLFDKLLTDFLKEILPDGRYPENVNDYLEWDDLRVWDLLKKNTEYESANRIIKRQLISLVYESPSHSDIKDKGIYNLLVDSIVEEVGEDNVIKDSADKLPHKIPARHDYDEEKSIPVIAPYSEIPTSLSQESEVINKITSPINILRIYAKEDVYEEARSICEEKRKKMLN